MTDSPIIALILAGGQSSRMGKSKAWLEYRGEAQVIWLYKQLKLHLDSVWISINEWPENQNPLPCIPDLPAYQNHGPMSGILSAFELKKASMLVIGCDYPLLNKQHLASLIEQRNPGADATVYFNTDGFYEPLFGIYEVSGLTKLKLCFESGNDSLSSFLKSANVQRLSGIQATAMKSVDSYQDYLEISKQLLSEENGHAG